MVDLDHDGQYYDRQSGMTVLFKTSQDTYFDFTIEKEKLDEDPESLSRYPQEYEEWSASFFLLMDELANQFNEANLQFTDKGIKPSDEGIHKLNDLTQQLASNCKSFEQLKPNYAYEVFHQGFRQTCLLFHTSYVKNLEGLTNKSAKRIQDSVVDFQIAYEWLLKIFNDNEEFVVGSDA